MLISCHSTFRPFGRYDRKKYFQVRKKNKKELIILNNFQKK
jgi:hypothetical protein